MDNTSFVHSHTTPNNTWTRALTSAAPYPRRSFTVAAAAGRPSRRASSNGVSAPAALSTDLDRFHARMAGLFAYTSFPSDDTFGAPLFALLSLLADQTAPAAAVSAAYADLWRSVTAAGKGYRAHFLDAAFDHAGILADAAQDVAVKLSALQAPPPPPPPPPPAVKRRGRKKKVPPPEPAPPPRTVCAEDLPSHILVAAQADLGLFQAMASTQLAEVLRSAVVCRTGIEEGSIPLLPYLLEDPKDSRRRLHKVQDWTSTEALDDIASQVSVQGSGMVGHYYGFRWDDKAMQLAGVISAEEIAHTPPLAFVGLEVILAKLHKNTEFLLHGLKSLNALLYGPPGCGKSSMVRSLLTTFGHRGLRIVEVAKQDIKHMPIIVEQLSNLPQKFVLFVDDLSFDESEAAVWRESKAAMEGSLRTITSNVVVYVTSNRRYPIGDAVSDATKEKVAFAHRFGLVLAFGTTTRAQYLSIVTRLADESKITLDQAALEDLALSWALGNDGNSNGLSGRTARQFIDHIASQQKLRGDYRIDDTVAGGYSNWSLNETNQN